MAMMPEQQQQLLEYFTGRMSIDKLVDILQADPRRDDTYVTAELRNAIQKGDRNELDACIHLLWISEDVKPFTDIMNELLVNPNHTQHQQIAKTLQDDVRSPSTIPFVEKVLATHFDFLAYTCSESDVIAKWFSWLLYAIGTPEAIAVIRQYAEDPDPGISKEMKYRLNSITPTSSSSPGSSLRP